MSVARHRRSFAAPLALLALLGVALGIPLAGCKASIPHVVKIGIVAPFEGRYREVGYDIIPAARLAIREYAERRDHPNVAIELVAYDDEGDPALAVEQARKLTIDPEVKIVIGHWRDNTTEAALPVYDQAHLPVIVFSSKDIQHRPGIYNLAPSSTRLHTAAQAWLARNNRQGIVTIDSSGDVLTDVESLVRQLSYSSQVIVGGQDYGLSQFYGLTHGQAEGVYFVTGAAAPLDMVGEQWPPDKAKSFTAGFEEGSLGAPPGLFSVTAYQATWLAITLVADMNNSHFSEPVAEGLNFGDDGRRIDAPVYLDVWKKGQPVVIERIP